jgi:hypothetical protein
MAAIACVMALAPAATSARAAQRTPMCATPKLVVWLDTQGGGAAGSTFYHLQFTNLSGRPCTLDGYPGVSAINLSGHQLGSAASRNATRAPRRITLAAGATATAVLRIGEASNFPASTCHQTSAAGLRVYPPNQTTSKTIPFPFHACSRTGPVYLGIEPLQGP